MINLSIVIPCYNEGQNIIPLFNKIEDLLKVNSDIEFIIVNNGSVDDTRMNILNSKLNNNKKIVVHEIKKNIGYGYGIMSGVKIAKGEYIGWCHADLQTEPKDVYDAYVQNYSELSKKNVLIKGSRINRNIFDNIFTIGMSVFASIVFARIISDINAQPKLFSKSFLKHLEDFPYDFSLDLYLLVIAKIKNYKIINHKVILKKRIYGDAKGGGNLIGKLKLIKRTFEYIVKLRIKLWKL